LREKQVDRFGISAADRAPLLKADIARVMHFARIGRCGDVDQKSLLQTRDVFEIPRKLAGAFPRSKRWSSTAG